MKGVIPDNLEEWCRDEDAVSRPLGRSSPLAYGDSYFPGDSASGVKYLIVGISGLVMSLEYAENRGGERVVDVLPDVGDDRDLGDLDAAG